MLLTHCVGLVGLLAAFTPLRAIGRPVRPKPHLLHLHVAHPLCSWSRRFYVRSWSIFLHFLYSGCCTSCYVVLGLFCASGAIGRASHCVGGRGASMYVRRLSSYVFSIVMAVLCFMWFAGCFYASGRTSDLCLLLACCFGAGPFVFGLLIS